MKLYATCKLCEPKIKNLYTQYGAEAHLLFKHGQFRPKFWWLLFLKTLAYMAVPFLFLLKIVLFPFWKLYELIS